MIGSFRIPLVFLVLTTLVFVGSVSAGPTPGHGAPGGGATRTFDMPAGQPLDLSILPEGRSVFLHMWDRYGYCWDLTGTRTGDILTVTGVVYNVTFVPWNAEGTITLGPVYETFLAATNPSPDECVTSTDYFEYTGEGRKRQGGTWVSYCQGEVVGSGNWGGVFYADPCRSQ